VIAFQDTERTTMVTTLPMPSTGDPAPAIDAATATGGHFSLAEQAGKWVVVYFYPRANTPG
jgi:thioredoxin-dependent peroxiredoxin